MAVERPWGWYRVLTEGTGYKVKEICVQPGHCTSLQYHHFRDEHWTALTSDVTVVTGSGEQQLTSSVLQPNQSVFIPRKQPHRLQNSSTAPIRIIEIQSGPYLEEDDIVRLEDLYHREQS